MDDTHYREAICPACGIIDRFGDKWSLRILFLLHEPWGSCGVTVG